MDQRANQALCSRVDGDTAKGAIPQHPQRQLKDEKQQKESLRVACLNRSKGKADFEKFVNWSLRLIPPCASKRGLLIILASNWAGGIVISTQS